jgi:hypothetical protein
MKTDLVLKLLPGIEAKWRQRTELYPVARVEMEPGLPVEWRKKLEEGREKEKERHEASWRSLIADPSLKAIDVVLTLYGSAVRPHVAAFIFDHICPDELFWPTLANQWNGFDAVPYEFVRLIRRRKAAWTPDCMSPEDRAGYDALPERFVLYRGQDRDQPIKSAWTLDADVAKRFSLGHRGIDNPDPTVFSATTTKANVALYQGQREEREIVVFRRPRIVSRQALTPRYHEVRQNIRARG